MVTSRSILDDAVAYWRACDYSGSGNLLDGKGGGRDGVISGCKFFDPDSGFPFVYFPGTAGNYIRFTDTNAFDVTGDITIIGRIYADDWTPTQTKIFLGKDNVGQRGIQAALVITSGLLRLVWFEGAAQRSADSTVAPTVSDAEWLWVKIILDVDNGASGRNIYFYTGGSGIVPSWTQLGTTVTQAGVTSIDSTTADIEIGTYYNDFGNRWAGGISHIQILKGIEGTPVFDWDATRPSINKATSEIREDGLWVPGHYGGSATTIHASSLNVTNDIDIAVRVNLEELNRVGGNGLVSKWQNAQYGWIFILPNSEYLQFTWTPDGVLVNQESEISTVKVSSVANPNEWAWFRVTVDTDNNDGDCELNFLYGGSAKSPAWEKLGDTVLVGNTSAIYDGTGQLITGGYNTYANSSPARGIFGRVVIRDGIDGPVIYDANFEDQPAGTTSFVEDGPNGHTVTVNQLSRVGTISRSDPPGEQLCEVNRPLFLNGGSGTITIADHADLNFGAGESFTAIAVVKAHGSPDVGYYWLDKYATSLGWRLYNISVNKEIRLIIGDGTNTPFCNPATETFASDTIAMLAGVRNVADDVLRSYIQAELQSGEATDTTTGTITNTSSLILSNQVTGESYGWALFRRVLTQKEMMIAGYALLGAEPWATRNPPLVTVGV